MELLQKIYLIITFGKNALRKTALAIKAQETISLIHFKISETLSQMLLLIYQMNINSINLR